MADEKDKQFNNALRDYLDALNRLKHLQGTGTATNLLLGDPLKGGLPGAVGETIFGSLKDLTTDQLLALIKSLDTLNDPQKEAQKKAAETGQVDFGLANAWFAKHWEEPRNCPICKKITWGIAPTFAQIPVTQLGLHAAPLRTNPCVSVICQTCGYTLYFNALVMGLLARSMGEKE